MGLLQPIERLGRESIAVAVELGGTVLLLLDALRWLVRRPLRLGLWLQQMEFVGAGSFFIVLLTGTFTGLVLALQLMNGFARFSAEILSGATIAIALSRELGPVLTALIVTGRVGSAMATELGTMRVTEQIDALQTMAVDPVQYLVVPRIVAGITMIPILTTFFNVIAMSAAYYISVVIMDLDAGAYMANIRQNMQPGDINLGIIKSVVFGVCISTVACFKGYNAAGGARGVGRATTSAVVTNFIAIFVLDYLITALAL